MNNEDTGRIGIGSGPEIFLTVSNNDRSAGNRLIVLSPNGAFYNAVGFLCRGSEWLKKKNA
jgi:hypothetical protein